MTSSFSHDDVFPVIERLIHELHRDKQDFVPHSRSSVGVYVYAYRN